MWLSFPRNKQQHTHSAAPLLENHIISLFWIMTSWKQKPCFSHYSSSRRWPYLSWWPAATPPPPATGSGPGRWLPAWCFPRRWPRPWWSRSRPGPESAGLSWRWSRSEPPPAPPSSSGAPLMTEQSDRGVSEEKFPRFPSPSRCEIHTFLGHVELLELGSLLVELGLQLLLESDELRPLLLQSGHPLLEYLWAKTEKNHSSHFTAVDAQCTDWCQQRLGHEVPSQKFSPQHRYHRSPEPHLALVSLQCDFLVKDG